VTNDTLIGKVPSMPQRSELH